MSTNFSFLLPHWRSFADTAAEAEQTVFSQPGYSCLLSRKSLEEWVRWLYDHDRDLTVPVETTLNGLMHEPTFHELIPPGMFEEINLIRKLGNQAVHTKRKIASEEAFNTVRFLFRFASWVVVTYSRTDVTVPRFDESLVPRKTLSDKTKEELQRVEQLLEQGRQELSRKEILVSEQEEQIKQLRLELEELNKIKQEHGVVEIPKVISEEQTRVFYIDTLLREAGWEPSAANVREFEVKGMPNTQELGYADYVLWGDDGLPLAVVEAKKTMKDPRAGQQQAKLYADCLQQMFGQRPVIYYTNGFNTWLWDDALYAPRLVQGFYTKDELALNINRRALRKKLTEQPINRNICERYYQEEAIRRVAEGFEKNKRRHALLVMATGTGKTRVAAAIVDLLTKANWVKKVLFLADRNALVRQAKNAFNQHLPQLTAIDLTKEKETESARVIFSTYPTMMNRIDGERTDELRFYSPGHFDLIIIDEAHRSVYQKYRAIFKYFDALLLGLTATPKAEVDKNTYELFHLEDHNPTAFYELTQGVNDKYLVPPKAIEVPVKFPREGIKYEELSDEEKREYEEKFGDPSTGESSDFIDSSALNEWLFNANTVDRVLQHLMDNGHSIEGGDKLGKTIIFAKNHRHALFIEERFNRLYPHYRGNFLNVIDNYATYADALLEQFKDPTKMPQIAVSVDMLDTGIDIPEILNLVFFKAVKSSTKYWQMIGRGTRLCKNLFGPEMDKKNFLVFDFCGNFEFFSHFPDGLEPAALKPLTQQIFEARLTLSSVISQTKSVSAEDVALRDLLLDTLHAHVRNLNPELFTVRMALEYVQRYSERKEWNALEQADMYNIREHVIPLIPGDEEPEPSKRFDLLMLKLQRAFIAQESSRRTYERQVTSLAGKLQKKSNIPAVAEKLGLIQRILEPKFWQSVNLNLLEHIRQELRDLLIFLDKEERTIVYTNFEDEISEVKEWEIVNPYREMESYKKRVERYIRENVRHVTISKLRHNQPITAAELQGLEDILFDGKERGTKEDFVKEAGNKPLGVFIRSILGMDRNAANSAFSTFLGIANLSADQIRFIDYIINYFETNGYLDKEKLFEPPFTDVNDKSVFGIFHNDQAGKVISIIDGVNKNAEVA